MRIVVEWVSVRGPESESSTAQARSESISRTDANRYVEGTAPNMRTLRNIPHALAATSLSRFLRGFLSNSSHHAHTNAAQKRGSLLGSRLQ